MLIWPLDFSATEHRNLIVSQSSGWGSPLLLLCTTRLELGSLSRRLGSLSRLFLVSFSTLLSFRSGLKLSLSSRSRLSFSSSSRLASPLALVSLLELSSLPFLSCRVLGSLSRRLLVSFSALSLTELQFPNPNRERCQRKFSTVKAFVKPSASILALQTHSTTSSPSVTNSLM